jgi:hypothetical protein
MTALRGEVLEMYARAETILVPKGENRQPVTALLEASGIAVPDMPDRRLHASRN